MHVHIRIHIHEDIHINIHIHIHILIHIHIPGPGLGTLDLNDILLEQASFTSILGFFYFIVGLFWHTRPGRWTLIATSVPGAIPLSRPLYTWVYVYVYACICICICVHKCMDTCRCIYTYTNTYIHAHRHIHTYKCINTHTDTYAYICLPQRGGGHGRRGDGVKESCDGRPEFARNEFVGVVGVEGLHLQRIECVLDEMSSSAMSSWA